MSVELDDPPVAAGAVVAPDDSDGWFSARLALLALAVVLWAWAVAVTDPDKTDSYGLLHALPATYFAALAVLAVSFVVTLASRRAGRWTLLAHVVALIVFVHATPAIVFPDARFAWVYTHVGVIDYIARHGKINPGLDIFQNWPALFALGAWFSRLAGVADARVYAPWAPVFFNVVDLAGLRFLLGALTRDIRLIWLACFVFFCANWIGQDYLAPQAFGIALALPLWGIALRWVVTEPPRRRLAAVADWFARRAGRRASPDPAFEHPKTPPLGPHAQRWAIAGVYGLFAVMVVGHQLTPYMVIAAAVVLTVAGMVRPRWFALGLVGLAFAWLIPHFSYLNRHFGLLASLGSILHNSHNAGVSLNEGVPGRLVTADVSRLLSVAVVGLAVVGWFRRARHGQRDVDLVLLVVAPVALVAVQDYGGEAVYRVYLFALPWLSFLAASALFPLRLGTAHRNVGARVAALAAALILLAEGLIPSYMGLEAVFRVRPGELDAVAYAIDTAPANSILMFVAPNVPVRLNDRYDRLRLPAGEQDPNLLSVPDFVHHQFGPADPPVIEHVLEQFDRSATDGFVLLTTGQQAYLDEYKLGPPDALARLDQALAASPDWRLVYRNADAALYEVIGWPAPVG